MSEGEEALGWVSWLRSADEAAAEWLWQRYFRRMVRLAARRLGGRPLRLFDAEDVALEAFMDFWLKLRNGDFSLEDETQLWALLAHITWRKGARAVEYESAWKRKGHGSDTPALRPDDSVLKSQPTTDPGPEDVAASREESLRLISLLDESERALVELKLQGLTNTEIAEQLGLSLKTVERRFQAIRKKWEQVFPPR
jgi:RNA polymerase sigma factor (sigma-70 family)